MSFCSRDSSVMKKQQQKRPDNRIRKLTRELKAEGVTGEELFVELADAHVRIKEAECAQRCSRCWHDEASRCICPHLHSLTPNLNIKVLILIHHREYLSAGNDAKLLLAMLPPENAELFVYGRRGDFERLELELAIDPLHTLTLWPAEDALSVERFKTEVLPPSDPYNSPPIDSGGGGRDSRPLLRVVVLDGVYNQARSMFRAMKKQLPEEINPPIVALEPTTLSVYHRAQKNYGEKQHAQRDADAVARICTVEAYALLLKEIGGEDEGVIEALVAGVVTNNQALLSDVAVRPASGLPTSESSGAARRKRRAK